MRTKSYWEEKLSEAQEKIPELRNQLDRLEAKVRQKNGRLKTLKKRKGQAHLRMMLRIDLENLERKLSEIHSELSRLVKRCSYYEERLQAPTKTAWERIDNLRL
jgi:chromosome segregation ATPase